MYYYTIPEYTVLYEHHTRIYEYKLVQQLQALALDGWGTFPVYWVLSSTSSFSSGWKLWFIMPKVRREIVKETSQGKHKIELNQWLGNVGRLHWKSSLVLSLNQLWSEVKLIPVPLELAGWQEQQLWSNTKSLEGGFVASPWTIEQQCDNLQCR
jgi:hypothetical protein